VIAVCLARYLPRADVSAVDISPDALQLARENARLNGVEERITFFESNWFDRVTGRFDLIVSNPPYVASEELEKLPAEIRLHEPRVALDGGREGLERIEGLIDDVADRLLPGGALLLEVGFGQAECVSARLRDAGIGQVAVETDVAGVERFVITRCP